MNSDLLEDVEVITPSKDDVWLIWAFKADASGREIRLAAVCTQEAIADRYLVSLPTIYPGYRLGKEKAPLDHAFGFNDGYQALLLGKMQ
ncbi:hypothetical protein GURKE_02400 [Brevundimonas phage vB_BpoS-Gurke]|uniref:Uncharacterized protein n=1 Tax=Brevundimonas phage vB_BpoS-Gurke TaxID=2948599 RepID=A0A9E7N1Q7_9CAUD|nr:hypothetical protein GURKE_02400 [Brevundimonas phage vB_BpoS-Gurke]